MNSLKSWKMESLTVNSSAGGYRRCACGEPVGVVECPEAVCQRVEKPVAVGVRHFDVRGYALRRRAPPVRREWSRRLSGCRGFGSPCRRHCGGSSRWPVSGVRWECSVFGYGHFQQAVVWQRACSLALALCRMSGGLRSLRGRGPVAPRPRFPSWMRCCR